MWEGGLINFLPLKRGARLEAGGGGRLNRGFTVIYIPSTLCKTDTLSTGTKGPSQGDVRLIESQLKEVKKGKDQQ